MRRALGAALGLWRGLRWGALCLCTSALRVPHGTLNKNIAPRVAARGAWKTVFRKRLDHPGGRLCEIWFREIYLLSDVVGVVRSDLKGGILTVSCKTIYYPRIDPNVKHFEGAVFHALESRERSFRGIIGGGVR